MTHSLWCSLLSSPEDGVIGPLWYLVRTSRTYVGFQESPDSVLEYRGAVLGDTKMLMLPDILGLSLTPYSRPGLEFFPIYRDMGLHEGSFPLQATNEKSNSPVFEEFGSKHRRGNFFGFFFFFPLCVQVKHTE